MTVFCYTEEEGAVLKYETTVEFLRIKAGVSWESWQITELLFQGRAYQIPDCFRSRQSSVEFSGL